MKWICGEALAGLRGHCAETCSSGAICPNVEQHYFQQSPELYSKYFAQAQAKTALIRPSWDDTWMRAAREISRRSACVKRQVGALVVSADNRNLTPGYNGAPAGMGPLCAGVCPQALGFESRCYAVHAEMNALMSSDRTLRTDGTIFVTVAPCWKCAVAIANSGLKRLVTAPWDNDRRDESVGTLAMLAASSIDVREYQ